MNSETGISIDDMVQDLIITLNGLVKNMAAGQYIRVCSIVVEMVQKLNTIRDQAATERAQMEQQIEDLKKRTDELAGIAFKGGQ